MMNKLTRRLFSCALAAALTAGLCLPASAYGNFKYLLEAPQRLGGGGRRSGPGDLGGPKDL